MDSTRDFEKKIIVQIEVQIETFKELQVLVKAKATVKENTDNKNGNSPLVASSTDHEDDDNDYYAKWLFKTFKNKISQASKIREIQAILFQETQIDLSFTDIKSCLQELIDKKKIVAIRFNESSNYLFCGLPAWVINTEKGVEFKEPFGPKTTNLPDNIRIGEYAYVSR